MSRWLIEFMSTPLGKLSSQNSFAALRSRKAPFPDAAHSASIVSCISGVAFL